jgi:gas vesicle protein
MEEMDRTRSALGWCLFGAVAGAATALLLAPHSGKQTRAKLAQGFRDTLDSAGELTDDLTDRARGAANKAAVSLTQRAAKVADTASNAARDTAVNLERHAERLSSR